MGILDGIVEWIAEQVMAGLDLVTTSVLGALGCDMAVFLRYFPAAETMYSVFVALAIGIILLNWVWQLFKNFGLGAGVEAEDPVKLSIRSVIFILLTLFSDEIVNIVLTIGGTPYHWIMESDLPALSFADFNSVMLVIIGVCANGAVALITLILVLILAWNYLKLLFEAAERYVLLGVLVYTAPVAFSMGASQTTANIWKSWCRMLGGQIFLLVMNAWCLRLFTSMVGSFLANPLSLYGGLILEETQKNFFCGLYSRNSLLPALPAGFCRYLRKRCAGSGRRCGKRSRFRQCVYLVSLCYRLSQSRPENRFLPLQSWCQCRTYRRQHAG